MPSIIWGSTTGAEVAVPWQGNCTLEGTRILNAGQANDDIALDYALPADRAGAEVYLQLDGSLVNDGLGADWSFASSSYAWESPGWLGDQDLHLQGDTSANGTIIGPDHIDGENTGVVWTEAWVDMSTAQAGTWPQVFALRLGARGGTSSENYWQNQVRFDIRCDTNAIIGGAYPYTPDLSARVEISASYSTTDILTGWHHIAVERDSSAGMIWLYVDGVCVASKSWDNASYPRLYSASYITPRLYSQVPAGVSGAEVNGLRVDTTTAYAGGSFTPHRYESGAVVARYDLASPMSLTSIDWAGNFGAEYGQVKAVYVYSAGSWLQVGDAYPTPPLTGLELMVAGPDLVKVELEPLQDALQSETPTLDWLSVVLEGLEEPRYPLRAAASQRCLGAPLSQHALAGTMRQRALDGEIA